MSHPMMTQSAVILCLKLPKFPRKFPRKESNFGGGGNTLIKLKYMIHHVLNIYIHI